MKWTQINVHTSSEAEEAVVQILLDMGARGVAVGTDGSGPVVTAYLAEAGPEAANAVQRRVAALAGFGLDPGAARVTVARVDDEDWAESWKRHYRPLEIGRRLLVKPAWIDIDPGRRLVIELDPGMAFGTGYHPTTALCLEALEDVVKPGHVVVDVGTGSGILGIAAARLGAAAVVGVDTEPEAVEAAVENVRRNGVGGVMTVARGSTDTARRMLAPPAQADVVVVNILARVIDRLAEELLELLKPGGVMVAGGIIDHAADGLMERLRSVGFGIEDERRRGEWCCLIARRVD
ncbi:MAG: 50S ribosomal protein L11 methyltransferase [Limnochordales bacterium]